ncbi:hypothetical protein JTE90_018735 [Oedothorax gibbosus]|uniref:Uncharacterized protein n=1 Tax=Oedothorax gibbosus TaxID=931172 RepID=A0AAV6TFD3_9ARAC|nr:hypothetical protein JTE90_018735 [Oedothorax gibbosus]
MLFPFWHGYTQERGCRRFPPPQTTGGKLCCLQSGKGAKNFFKTSEKGEKRVCGKIPALRFSKGRVCGTLASKGVFPNTG